MKEQLIGKEKEIYLAAIEKWGMPLQWEMVVEECAELIVAIKHLNRERDNLLPLLEEIADVEIMLGQVRCMIDPELIDEMKRKKLSRLASRLGIS